MTSYAMLQWILRSEDTRHMTLGGSVALHHPMFGQKKSRTQMRPTVAESTHHFNLWAL
jgi:hypothetical protein